MSSALRSWGHQVCPTHTPFGAGPKGRKSLTCPCLALSSFRGRAPDPQDPSIAQWGGGGGGLPRTPLPTHHDWGSLLHTWTSYRPVACGQVVALIGVDSTGSKARDSLLPPPKRLRAPASTIGAAPSTPSGPSLAWSSSAGSNSDGNLGSLSHWRSMHRRPFSAGVPKIWSVAQWLQQQFDRLQVVGSVPVRHQ